MRVCANTLREGLASPQDVLAMAAHTTDANTSSPMTGSVCSRWLDHPQSDGRSTCEDDDGHISVRRRAEAALEWLTGPAQLTDLVPFFTTHRAGERVERAPLVGRCSTTNLPQSAGPDAPCRSSSSPVNQPWRQSPVLRPCQSSVDIRMWRRPNAPTGAGYPAAACSARSVRTRMRCR